MPNENQVVVERMSMYYRHLITCTALWAACCFACRSEALGQIQFDKAQLEQVEILERQVLYHPHLYGADHLEQFQRGGVKLSIIPGGDHNDIFSRGKKELYESMKLARRAPSLPNRIPRLPAVPTWR